MTFDQALNSTKKSKSDGEISDYYISQENYKGPRDVKTTPGQGSSSVLNEEE